MSRMHIFADEAGCLTFARKPNVSKNFILCTIMTRDCSVATTLLELRRKLAWEGAALGDYFHATTDCQAVRDSVFSSIEKHDFTIQATIMEKSKSQPQIRRDQYRFYKHGWFYHFKYGIGPRVPVGTETLVTAASIGQRKERATFTSAIDDVMSQTMDHGAWKCDFCPAGADPCVQVADYCAWAIQRKHERGDARSYDLIKDRITYEYDLWSRGTVHYY